MNCFTYLTVVMGQYLIQKDHVAHGYISILNRELCYWMTMGLCMLVELTAGPTTVQVVQLNFSDTPVG